jgi:hypothetical protein
MRHGKLSIVTRPGPSRLTADITVFKNNCGQGMAELAIVDLTLTRSREKKLGVELTWGEGY